MRESCNRTVFCATPENHRNLRNHDDIMVLFVKTVYRGTESISFLRPKIWDIVPTELKQVQSLNSFEKSIRKWVPKNCPCRFCKRYVDVTSFFYFYAYVLNIFLCCFYHVVLVDTYIIYMLYHTAMFL